MRRVLPLVVGAVVGALAGAALGWALLRPSNDDLLDAARGLVPESFAVVGAGVDTGQVLLGWPDVAIVHASGPDASRDVDLPAVVAGTGWTVDRVADDADGWRGDLRRPGMVADLDLRPPRLGDPEEESVGTAGADLLVTVQRDGSEDLVVGLAALGGAVLGAAGVGVVRARRHRGADPIA